MGQFRVVIEGVGGHVTRRELVEKYKRLGFHDLKATFTHWPDTEHQVIDDLVANVRRGSFES